MKLFRFYPDGHGPLSYFVNAETQEEAHAIVTAHINKCYPPKNGVHVYEAKEWGTDYWLLEECEIGQVLENSND